jgi:hypothetical protein
MARRVGYAADAVLVAPVSGRLEGPEAIHRHERGLLAAFPGATVTVLRRLAQGDSVAVEWEFRGVHAGPIALPGGVVPATNRPLTLRGASFFRHDAEGLIVEERRYYDVWRVFEQLGLS